MKLGGQMINLNATLKGKIKTLKFISKDTSGNDFLTDSRVFAIWYDKVKDNFVREKHLPQKQKSIDGLLFFNDIYYFIEFKNQREKSLGRAEIIQKMYDSLIIFWSRTGFDMNKLYNDGEFVLVYNEDKLDGGVKLSNSFDKIVSSVNQYRTNPPSSCKGMKTLPKAVKLYFSKFHLVRKKDFPAFLTRIGC